MIWAIGANKLVRDNVAILAREREIGIEGPTAYTDENLDILAEVIRKTTSLEELVFKKGTGIAIQHDKVIDALANNRTLKTLNLWASYFGDEGAKTVATILKENSTIQSVSLGFNKIGDEGAKAIADALKVNKTLQYIALNDNRIGTEGAKAIAGLLKENTSLQKLFVWDNNIGEKGGKHILNALQQIGISAIENINLRQNQISEETLAKINQEMIRIKKCNIGEEGGKQILNALQQIERSATEIIDLRLTQISEETLTKIRRGIARIQEGFKSVRSIEGPVVANATAAGSQGFQNKRSSSNEDDEGMTTIHTTNASQSQGSAENVDETNQRGQDTTAMETKIKEQQSIITQLKGKIAEQDKELASTKDILKTIGNLANDKDGGTIRNARKHSMPDRETELQSEIERYKQENNSLKEQLKNSRPIETVDLTNANEIEPASESGEDSNEEKPPSKRRRTKSNLAVALEQTQQLVEVKEEAKERAAAAEANVTLARREKDAAEASLRDVREDLEDSNELVTQQTLTTDIWQGRFDELFELARAAGVDGNTLSEIRYRPLSSGR
jgi:hypothetical protein